MLVTSVSIAVISYRLVYSCHTLHSFPVFELEKIDITSNKKKSKLETDRDSKGSLNDLPKTKGDFGKTPSRSLNDSSHTNMSANKLLSVN